MFWNNCATPTRCSWQASAAASRSSGSIISTASPNPVSDAESQVPLIVELRVGDVHALVPHALGEGKDRLLGIQDGVAATRLQGGLRPFERGQAFVGFAAAACGAEKGHHANQNDYSRLIPPVSPTP